MVKINKFIFWTPRILAILFILFLALFSLDVFDGNYGFWETFLGLFMHNLPSLILLIILIISWKHELVGAVAFISAGLLYIVFAITRAETWQMVLLWIFQISGIAFLIGILFLICWKQKKKSGRKIILKGRKTNTKH
ncbi:hypothetical protein J4463_00770 [Candidatus Pacearchaeota archaeon]|nr:hypothetical protein [Candidatus Pacearchaeota archaeon]